MEVDNKYLDCTACYNFEWQIHNFTKDSIQCIQREGVLGSQHFEILLGDNLTKWECRAIIHPFKLKFYFFKEESDENEFDVYFNCFIPTKTGLEDAMFINYDRETPAFAFERPTLNNRDSAVLNFDKIFAEPKKYIQDDILTISLQLKLRGYDTEDENHDATKYHENLSSNFNELYYSGDFSDFTIICADGIEFPVHRCVLSVHSPVFKAMLQTKMRESIENLVNVDDIDGQDMNEILHFIYTQKVRNMKENLQGLMYGAEKYQLENLKEQCLEYMNDHIKVENAIEFFRVAYMYGLEDLIRLCMLLFNTFYFELKSSEAWTDLSSPELNYINQALKDYDTRFNVEKSQL